MKTVKIDISTCNDNLQDFDYLFSLWEQVGRSRLDVTFAFPKCQFLRQNAVAFLGGLARLIEHNSGIVHFDWNSLKPDIRQNLVKSGFFLAFGGSTSSSGRGNAIPYREDEQYDEKEISHYLKRRWLANAWIAVSDLLRDKIVSNVVEVL